MILVCDVVVAMIKISSGSTAEGKNGLGAVTVNCEAIDKLRGGDVGRTVECGNARAVALG
jgi:hypothetical protein